MSAALPKVTRETLLATAELTLPYPISANRYWSHGIVGRRAVTFVTKEAIAYKRECAWLAKAEGFTSPTKRPIELAFTLYPPATMLRRNPDMTQSEVRCGTRMDLDNALKVAIDALKKVVYEDDDQVHRIRIEYGERDGRGKLVVEISEFVPAPAPLFAVAGASGGGAPEG